MNRILVEPATHPTLLNDLEQTSSDRRWDAVGYQREGSDAAKRTTAQYALLDRTKPFNKCEIKSDERLATRLGAADRLITFNPPRHGPFGTLITALRLPAFLTKGIEETEDPQEIVNNAETLSFRFGSSMFFYDRFGVTRAN